MFWIYPKWNKIVQSWCATIFSQMYINSFGDLLIYILCIKVLFQREEVGKGWKGRKRILFKYFTIHSKSSYVLSPYSLVDLTPPLIKSHMVIPSCQAAFISSKTHTDHVWWGCCNIEITGFVLRGAAEAVTVMSPLLLLGIKAIPFLTKYCYGLM